MTDLATGLEIGGGIAGGWAGRGVGATIGTMVCGPICGWVGGVVGGRVGSMAGKALAGSLAHMMEGADQKVEEQTKPAEQAKPCEACGEIECFNPPKDPSKLAEFRRQLDEQQKTINDMEPDKLMRNMDNYHRPPSDAVDRRLAREEYRERRTNELTEQYRMQGKGDPKGMAAAEVAKELAQLNATHTLDLIAGGDGSISGLGDASVNKSIGAQWRGQRAGQLYEHAKEARKQGKKMNVELKECPPKGGGSRSTDGPDGQDGQDPPGSGPGISDVPMS